ncbi:hypothetical protein WK78_22080 [Burkholderia cepacia]|nr:hypothetical protein WK78_22080 [Burkholderia cepacia]MCW3706033.1 helix-turn-helix transcriptional regulator [Burkholderia cenocepacia]MCW3730522.1 helix-turn-helix transcriptional regulator [Burkholderia cenocepacia]OQD21301.1 hypothetical protein UE98_20575 [Burkholderia cenocepacia]
MNADSTDLFDDCQRISDLFTRIGDKWSVYVLMLLSRRSLRFGELQNEIVGISRRMLTLTLRGLERDGLLTRTVFPVVPPKVEYDLTPLGQSLVEVLLPLGHWAMNNACAIDAARDMFDKKVSDTE